MNAHSAGGEPALPFRPITTQAQLEVVLGRALGGVRDEYEDLQRKAAQVDLCLTERRDLLSQAREQGAAEARERLAPRLALAHAREIATRLGFINPQRAADLIDCSAAIDTSTWIVDESVLRDQLHNLADSDPYMVRRSTERPSHRHAGFKRRGVTTMTTDTTIDDPVGEFAVLPGDVQQSLLTLLACVELMLPEERSACANAQLAFAAQLAALQTFPLTALASIELIELLVLADRHEKAADEKRGL